MNDMPTPPLLNISAFANRFGAVVAPVMQKEVAGTLTKTPAQPAPTSKAPMPIVEDRYNDPMANFVGELPNVDLVQKAPKIVIGEDGLPLNYHNSKMPTVIKNIVAKNAVLTQQIQEEIQQEEKNRMKNTFGGIDTSLFGITEPDEDETLSITKRELTEMVDSIVTKKLSEYMSSSITQNLTEATIKKSLLGLIKEGKLSIKTKK